MAATRRSTGRDTRAVLYLRQSIAREESVSLEQQETACREHCRRRGYLVTEVISDPGLSGRKWDKRPGVQRAMQLVDDGAADVIILWKWSRISRRRLDFEIAMDRAESAGGRIESATEPIDVTTASGRFARGMLAQVADFESERISEDWQATHRRRRAKGVPAQGGRRYGYTRLVNDEGRTYAYEPHPEESGVLRWMYAQVIEGRGAGWIAAELNRRGISNPVGEPWAQGRVYRLLDSGFAAGLIVHAARDKKTGRPLADRVYHDGVHPTVIDRATWEAYRAVRRLSVGRPARTVEARYPLTGLTRCADCSAAMWPARAKGKGPGYTLVCGRWQATRQGRCVTVARHRAEDAVKVWLAGYATELEDQARTDTAGELQLARARRDEQTARRLVTELEGKLARLNRAWLDGTVADEGYAQTRDELLGELKTAQADVEAAQDARSTRRPVSRDEALTLVDRWHKLPPADIRNTLRHLIDHVLVTPPERPHGRSTLTVVAAFDDA